MNRYSNLILLIIALSINIFVRLGPALLLFTKEQAKNFVMVDLREEARKQIDEKFKELPAAVKPKVANDLFNTWQKGRKKSLNELIKNKQKELKSYWQDESGHTFLLESDPYHWFRLIRNLVRQGKLADKTVGNTPYDTFMLAPADMEIKPSLHKNFQVYLNYYIFKVISIFNKNISLKNFLFYMPLCISILALILSFFLASLLSRNKFNIAGFFAVIILGLAPIFLHRSLVGWFDTDPYLILFSLLSIWTFYSSLNYATSLKKRLLFSVSGGITMGVFSFTWDGWWYIFDLMIISVLFYIFNLYLIKRNSQENIDIKIPLLSLCTFILSSIIFIGIFSGWEIMRHFFSEPAKLVFAKGYLQKQFWPNTFLTVSELNSVYFSEMLDYIGGGFILFLAALYLLIALLDKQSAGYLQRQYIIMLFVFWILVISYVSLNAVRFSLLMTVPIAISFGLCIERFLEFAGNLLSRIKRARRIKQILAPLFCIAFLPLILKNGSFALKTKPFMNKDWWGVLKQIKLETAQDAIINSWWDYGHWFKAISERRVVFDGATQNTPIAYWMGRFFLSDNEAEAVGILRMLNSGSNRAFEELEKLGIDKFKCLNILNEIIALKEKDALNVLSKYIPKKEDRERILKYTHHPQSAYFIVEPSLIYKMNAISFLGNWDFKKAKIYQRFKEAKKEGFIDYLIKEYKYNKDEALRLYDTLIFLNTQDALSWISTTYNYYVASKSFRKEDSLLLFDNGFVVNLANYQAYFRDAKKIKWEVPKSIFYLEGDALKEIIFPTHDLDFSVLLIQEKDSYKLIPLDGKIVNSMLTRLYYLGGRGLKNFKPFITQELKDNRGHIIVYKIEWDKDG